MDASKMRMLGDRVLIQRAKAEEKTEGGIIIPDNAKERPVRGKVLAVGPGTRTSTGAFVETTVKVGDVVLFGKYAGSEPDARDDRAVIVREDDILAVVTD